MGQIVRRRRPTVRGWYAIRLGIAGLMVASAFVLMSARAMACPVTDLSCLPETTADPVTAIAGTTTSTVDQATTTVDETAAAVTDQANQAVDTVTHTVKGIVEQTPDPIDPGVIDDPTGILPDVLGSTVTQSSGPGATEVGGDGTATGPGEVKSRTVDGAGPVSFGRGPVFGPVTASISSTPAASPTIPPPGPFERIGSLAIKTAKILSFPLALALIVLLFVAVQNRIDRKDPKLALAPVAPDLLRFE
jgi:hypothetical protein